MVVPLCRWPCTSASTALLRPSTRLPLPTVTSFGSLVLACEGEMQAWFEAVAVAMPGDALIELQWRDWPAEPLIVRRRGDLALVSFLEGSGQ